MLTGGLQAAYRERRKKSILDKLFVDEEKK
jgi:hypothetical protein